MAAGVSTKKKSRTMQGYITIGISAVVIIEMALLIYDTANIRAIGSKMNPIQINYGFHIKNSNKSNYHLLYNTYINSLSKYISRGTRYEKNSALIDAATRIMSRLLEDPFVNSKRTEPGLLRKTTLIIDRPLPGANEEAHIIKQTGDANLKVVMVTSNPVSSKAPPHVDLVHANSKFLYKLVLKTLLDKTKAEYVIMTKDTSLDIDQAKIEKVLKLISINGADVVGSSVVDGAGRWRLGCYLTKTLWYQYRVVEGFDTLEPSGYHHCDYVAGAIVVRRQLLLGFLKSIKSKEIAVENVWPQFFQYLGTKDKIVKLESGLVSRLPLGGRLKLHETVNKKLALNFCTLNGLSKFVPPSDDGRKEYEFTCSAIKSSCYPVKGKGLIMSKCCHKDLDDLLLNTMKVFDRKSWHYNLIAGTAIGGMKLEMTLPWELDHDVHLESAHLLPLKSLAGEFKLKYGYGFVYEYNNIGKCLKQRSYICGWMGIKSRFWRMEIPGRGVMYDDIIAKGRHAFYPNGVIRDSRVKGTHTRTLMSGYWMMNVPSPGSYTRLKYGRNVLKHVKHIYANHMSWNQNFFRRAVYKWDKCDIAGHHACLEEFPVDGNLGFRAVSA